MNKLIFGILIVAILWIYLMQYHKISTEHSVFAQDLITSGQLKTGDLILFKAYNNFNSIFHGSYFGHIGMVYIHNGVPMIFEANGIERVPLLPKHSRKGVFLTELNDRIRKYKGRCFYKPLNKSVSDESIKSFENFMKYALDHLEYDYDVISGGLSRGLGLERCGKKTDCGQIMYLSLISLGLIPIEDYEVSRFHHLKYVCGLSELANGYKYNDLIEVVDHPFDDRS